MNNEELIEIAAQLRALAARVEALTGRADGAAMSEEADEPEPTTAPEQTAKPARASQAAPGLTISLNDRYRFRRELFGGSGEVMDLALEAIGAMTSAAEVEHYLINNDYDMDSDIVKDFLQATTRRFDSRPPLLA